MNLDSALQTFIAEAQELLQDMEEALLRIEQTPDDADTINSIFRAAHTIKGSAGLFGLDDIVRFTHVAESILDRVRAGQQPVDGPLVALLLASADHIKVLVETIANRSTLTADAHQTGQALVERLQVYLGEDGASPVAQLKLPTEYVMPYTTQGGGQVETDLWHISVRFGPNVMRNGMDPLSFIRYLSTLGDVHHIVTLFDTIPAAAEMDPERCYLGFEISLKSNADKAAIEGVFDFVIEESQVRIVPPRSKITEYLQFIADLPGDELRLGEILVRCGTLTATELQTALAMQQDEGGEPQRPIGQVLADAQLAPEPVIAAALEKQRQMKESRQNATNLIRVDADKLDQLINLVGELIIAGAGTTLIAQRTGIAELLEATATLSRLVEQVRDSALTLRMVQIGATFSRFQRVVRDVSTELGKDIELVISGADTELDKTVVEKIGDPLTHLVRNSMDHGIESAEVRLARGKPARGTLKLNAYHDAGSIVIEVADDGGGLNKERILKKAVERGLVSEGQTLSDQEIYNLIFEPGFSTADSVSNLSGRGVGMDVVRRNIQALRGTVDLYSTPGEGSTVRIQLPLTLAIIDGFLVNVDEATYVIPLDMVVECTELSSVEREVSDRRYLNLRGEVLPYRRLREHFQISGPLPRRENVVVVRYGQFKAGLVVDKLMGEFQTVIKPVGKVFGQVKGVGGFTILGSGEVALILDVPGLLGQVVGSADNQGAASTRLLA